jgi:hypothetical protein
LRDLSEVLKGDGVAVVECSHGVLTDAETGLKPHVSAIRTLPKFTTEMLRSAGYNGEIINYAVHRAYEIRHGAGPMPTYDPESFDSRLRTWDEIAGAMCQAELVHEVIILLSFLPILASIPFGALPVFAITSVLAACYDGMFVIMQRYNRPRIVKLVEKAEKRGRAMIQEAVDRIRQMEQIFDELQEAAVENPSAIREDTALREMMGCLVQYYEGGQWQKDYELDEIGLIPQNLKRGILSQDAVYDFLERFKPYLNI